MPAKGTNTKKEAGNAKKAANAAAKQAKVDAVKAAKEDEEWAKGSKSNAKKDAADAKKREAALKKAERDAELAKEESSIKTVKTNPKAASKKPSVAAAKASSSLDAALAAIDGPSSSSSNKGAALHASGIDDALDALSLAAAPDTQSIDRHPERRVKAAYRAFEERRMKEGKDSGEFAGLRQNQIKDRLWDEFQKSEENPHNKANIVSYDARRDDITKMKQKERDAIESRLTKRDL